MLSKNFINRTRVKYILSYLFVILILFIGFYFVVQKQFLLHFHQQYCDFSSQQLDHLVDYIDKSIISTEQIHKSLQEDVTLISTRYSANGYENYIIMNTIAPFDSISNHINCIVYMAYDSQEVISTNHWVTYDSGVFSILSKNNMIKFNPTPYYNTSQGHLIYVSTENSGELIYFPAQSITSDHIIFYIIDTTNLVWQMNPIMNDFITSIALINYDKQIIAGHNTDQLATKLDSIILENGIHNIDDSFEIIINNILCDFSVVSLVSNDLLHDKINNIFFDAYLTLTLLILASLAGIFFAMKFTYKPLHELISKVNPEFSTSQSYVSQLRETFDSITKHNQLLAEKLEHYRVSLQKDLLSNIVSSCSDVPISVSDLDAFFISESSKRIVAICFRCSKADFTGTDIQKYLKNQLANNLSSILVNQKTDNIVLLISYIESSKIKYETLVTLLHSLYNEQQVFSAISNASDSLLDISSLYRNAVRASNYWPDIPVAEYKLFPPEINSFEYPHDIIKQLSVALLSHDFESSRNHVEKLFQIIDFCLLSKDGFPEFITQNILVEILTNIVNSMNISGVKIKYCSNQYFETLYYCGNFPYIEKCDIIKSNTYSLISFYEEQINELYANSEPFIQMFEEYYADPNFSITLMADKFNVSTTYMSYLIKESFKMNFSDYLWNIRLSKASELLINTDMSIDKISVSVGYLNTSSFRRKFKQETGLSPSQFRNNHMKKTAN